jgi:hypothetical protein
MEQHGFFLLGENAQKGMFKEHYETYSKKEGFIGIFITNDMSDRSKAKFWKDFIAYQEKENIFAEGLFSCVYLLFKNKV